LRGMTCAKHFEHWDRYPSVLPDLVDAACDDESKETVRGWTALLTGLLALDPAQRLSARAALAGEVFRKASVFSLASFPHEPAKPAAHKDAKPAAELAQAWELRDAASPDSAVLDGACALTGRNDAARAARRDLLVALARTCSLAPNSPRTSLPRAGPR